MATWLSLHYHIIFSTKYRQPWFRPEMRDELFRYLGGTVNGLGGETNGAGGVADHVHLLVSLRATHCLADLMRELKKASSMWIKERWGITDFAWQDGYCAVTVSPSSRPAVHDYIARQEDHHRKRTFREELVDLLTRAGVSFDPKYLE